MKLYKFRTLDNLEFVLDILLNERLYCSNIKDLNYPLEGLFYTIIHPIGTSQEMRNYKTVEELPTYYSDLRICSLSKTLKDIRIWSHYAGGHTGVAIEIEFDGYENDLTKVNYNMGLQKHGSSILTAERPHDVLSHKTQHWDYEKEYRIINPKEDFYPIKGRISAVYFGVRTSEYHKELLRKSSSKNINFIDTRLDRKNIVIRPLKNQNC